MAYLQSYRGDYLGGRRGDPFFGSILKGAIGVVKGAVTGGIRSFIRPAMPQYGTMPVSFPGGLPTFTPGAGGRRGGRRTSPYDPGAPAGMGRGMPKRRRMNPANAKALRRAIRRTDSFVKLARKALKGTKYTISTRGSSSRRPALSITETGPGNVTVRR